MEYLQSKLKCFRSKILNFSIFMYFFLKILNNIYSNSKDVKKPTNNRANARLAGPKHAPAKNTSNKFD